MLGKIPPNELDQVGIIQEPSIATDDQGESTTTWSNVATNVKFKWLNPPRTAEIIEGQKPVGQQKRSAKLRKENRNLDGTMRLVADGENWYIEGVRPFKSTRNIIVLDVIHKDK